MQYFPEILFCSVWQSGMKFQTHTYTYFPNQSNYNKWNLHIFRPMAPKLQGKQSITSQSYTQIYMHACLVILQIKKKRKKTFSSFFFFFSGSSISGFFSKSAWEMIEMKGKRLFWEENLTAEQCEEWNYHFVDVGRSWEKSKRSLCKWWWMKRADSDSSCEE